MPANLNINQLQALLSRLEREISEARRDLARLNQSGALTDDEWWKSRARRVRSANEILRPSLDGFFKEMGLKGDPIGAEKVQEMIGRQGVKTEENLFSKGIVEMREE